MSRFERSILSQLAAISAIIFCLIILLRPLFPSVSLFNFDVFYIFLPIISLFGTTVAVVYLFQEVVYSHMYFFTMGFFLYVVGFVAPIQIYPINISSTFGYLSLGILVIVLVTFIRHEDQLELIIHALYISCLVLTLVAIWELSTGSHLPASRLSTDEYSGQYASTIYTNRNNFSFFLSMLSPVLTYGFVCKRWNWYINSLLFLLLGSGLTLTIINDSRVATVSHLLGISIVLCGIYLRKRIGRIHRWPYIGSATYIVSAILSISLPLILSNPFSQEKQGSLFARWELMQAGAEHIQSSPFAPSGLGMFEQAVPVSGNQLPGTAHNWAIQLGVETSLIGLILFIASIGLLSDRLFSIYYNHQFDWALPVAVSLLLFPLNGLGPSNVLSQARIFWIFVGIGLTIIIVSGKSSSGTDV